MRIGLESLVQMSKELKLVGVASMLDTNNDLSLYKSASSVNYPFGFDISFKSTGERSGVSLSHRQAKELALFIISNL